MGVADSIARKAYLKKGELGDGIDPQHEAMVEDLLRTAAKEDDEDFHELAKLGYPGKSSVLTAERNRIEKPKRTKKQLIDLFSVAEVLAAEGLNPALEIAKALKSDQLDLDTKVKLHATLLEYVAPKLKSVEMSGTVKIERTQEEIEARLKELAMMAAPVEKDVTDPGTGTETSA